MRLKVKEPIAKSVNPEPIELSWRAPSRSHWLSCSLSFSYLTSPSLYFPSLRVKLGKGDGGGPERKEGHHEGSN